MVMFCDRTNSSCSDIAVHDSQLRGPDCARKSLHLHFRHQSSGELSLLSLTAISTAELCPSLGVTACWHGYRDPGVAFGAEQLQDRSTEPYMQNKTENVHSFITFVEH